MLIFLTEIFIICVDVWCTLRAVKLASWRPGRGWQPDWHLSLQARCQRNTFAGCHTQLTIWGDVGQSLPTNISLKFTSGHRLHPVKPSKNLLSNFINNNRPLLRMRPLPSSRDHSRFHSFVKMRQFLLFQSKSYLDRPITTQFTNLLAAGAWIPP